MDEGNGIFKIKFLIIFFFPHIVSLLNKTKIIIKNIQLLFLTFLMPFLSFSQEKGLHKRIEEAFKPISDFFSDVVFF